MRCEEARLLAMAVVDGNAKPFERRMLEEHLAHCSDCRRFLRDEKRLWDVLGCFEGIGESEGLCEAVMVKVRRGRSLFWRVVGAVAAVAAVLLVLVFAGPFGGGPSVDEVKEVAEKAELLENLEVLEQLSDEELEIAAMLDFLSELDEAELESE